ncbi:methyltransferase [Streptomyces koyangensis]
MQLLRALSAPGLLEERAPGTFAGTAAVLPHAFDFGRFRHVADVGGGDGTLLAGVLASHPHLTGAVFDTAEGLSRAPETIERHGLSGCCTPVAGFFRSVPGGSDLYRRRRRCGHLLSDLNMPLNLGGGERTREEFAKVCRRAGLALTSVIPLPEAVPYHLIEAVAG